MDFILVLASCALKKMKWNCRHDREGGQKETFGTLREWSGKFILLYLLSILI